MKIPITAFPVLVVSLGVLLPCIVGPPVIPEEAKEARKTNRDEGEMGLEYERYLKEVIGFLEQDKEFRDKLGSAKMEDITSGKIANELPFVSHHIRTKLDELKRQEIERLRRLARQENELSNGIDRRMVGMPLHLDVKNEHTFEVADLRKLVQRTTRDLEDLDKQRREEFKSYEMEKEHRRQEQLKKLDEEKRKLAEQEYMEKQKRHKDHPKLHHPGSKQQLEEVWEQEDQLPTEEFNPKTFFRMHDLDGDEYWNPDEVMGLFQHELDKMYSQNNTDDDMEERREEMDRMREHVVNETDTNKDGLISMAEFLEMTRRNEFNQDPGWQGLDEQEMYPQEDFREYERLAQLGMHPDGMPNYVPEGMHPGAGYQHMPPNPQMGGQHPQQGYPQPIPPGPYDHQMPNYQGGQQQFQQQQYQQGYPQGQVPQYQQGYPQGQVPQYQGGPPQGHVPQHQGGPPQGHVPQYQGGAPHGQQQYVQQQGMPQQHNAQYQQQQPPQQFQNAVPPQGLPQQPSPPPPPQQQQQQQQQQPQEHNLPNAQVPPQQSSTEHPPQTAEAVTAKLH